MGLLVVFIGTTATESYYGYFGLRYQFLNLSATHILYRGITAIPNDLCLVIPYLLVFGWLSLDLWLAGQRWTDKIRSPFAYAVIIGILTLTYPLARSAGARQAEKDAGTSQARKDAQSSSTLPAIFKLQTARVEIEIGDHTAHEIGIGDNFRLLAIEGDFVVIFKELRANEQPGTPRLQYVKKQDVTVLETN
jgi:hypothetical protein